MKRYSHQSHHMKGKGKNEQPQLLKMCFANKAYPSTKYKKQLPS